jgi:hypothetical protein
MSPHLWRPTSKGAETLLFDLHMLKEIRDDCHSVLTLFTFILPTYIVKSLRVQDDISRRNKGCLLMLGSSASIVDSHFVVAPPQS